MLAFIFVSILAMSGLASAQYCNMGFQNYYQCSGNWQQQLYINPDCSQYWSSVQYCNSGCVNGFCQGTTVTSSGCSVSASMTTPQTINSGDLATTTITLTNTGGTAATVTVNGYICNADGTTCFNIPCSSNSVSVPANSVAYDVCSARNYYGYYSQNGVNPGNYPYYPYNYPNNYPNNYPYSNANQNYPYYYYPGNFRIRADFNGCSLATTMYTGVFAIQPYQYCTAGNTNNYQCSGSTRQVQHQNSDCTTSWTNVENCQNGCANGVCLTATPTPTSTSTVTTTTTVTAMPQIYLPDFSTVVVILALIVLLIILFKLLTDREGGRRYHRDEYWRLWRNDLGNFFSRLNSRKAEVC